MEESKEIKMVPLEDIIPNRFQPRIAFGEKELEDLASSIKEHGIIQPLVLRKLGEKYEIIAGERRYKAATMVGLSNVPAIIVETDDKESAQIAIVENVQRKDLTAIEEAKSYQKLQEKGMTQEEISKKIGVSQPVIANKLRLLNLNNNVQQALLNNKISERHARSLLELLNKDELQDKMLDRIIDEKLTVKQTEDEINKLLRNVNVDLSKSEVIKKEDIDENIDFSKLFSSPSVEKQDFIKPQVIESPIEAPSVDFENKEVVEPEEVLFDTQPEEKQNIFINPFQEEKETNTEAVLENPFMDLNVKEDSNPIINEFKEQKSEPDFNGLEQKSISKAINTARDFTKNMENEGYNISTEEFDFEDMYQIVIKIKKD